MLVRKEFQAGGFRFDLDHHKTGEPIAVLNKWFEQLEPNEIALDINNLGIEIILLLQREGIIGDAADRVINGGFAKYPVFKLTDKAFYAI